MSEKEKTRKELAKQLNAKINEVNKVEKLEELIKDNKIVFEIEKVTYRVRKPNFKETEFNGRIRNKKKIELLEDPKCKLREELIKLYKENGKDILELERNINSYPSRMKPIQNRLAQVTVPKDIALYKDELEKLEESQLELILERNECMSACIEKQVTEYANLYMTYLVTEKKVEDKWVKAFNSYEEYLEQDEVIMQSTNYLSLLIYRRQIIDE